MIRGVILEQVPNQGLKIQTADGNIFAYSYGEIEKITKESVGEITQQAPTQYGTQRPVGGYASRTVTAKPVTAKQDTPKLFRPYYESGYELGYSIAVGVYSDAGRITFSTTHGCHMPYFYAGAGLGVDYYHSLDAYGIPFFGDIRGYLFEDDLKPFANFRIGYSVGDVSGLYFSPSIGVNYKDVDISIGYTYQGFDNEWDDGNLSAITLKLGIRF